MRALLALALLTSPVVAFAQTASDTAALSAARDLMAATDVQGQMRAMAPALAKAMDQQVRQMFTNDQLPDGLAIKLSGAMQDYVASMDSVFTPELIDEMASIYARHFSAADLIWLTKVMKDPIMAKFRTETPALMGEMMPSMMTAMKPQQEAFMVKIKQIVADWISQHPKDKAKLRSPSAT